MEWVYDDGGRKDAGYIGEVSDCVIRSIAIATEIPYQEVYDKMHEVCKSYRGKAGKTSSPRNGFYRQIYNRYMASIGWSWTPTMTIGSGCHVHLRANELPTGRLVVAVSKHMTAVIDGVIHDTHDPSRDGMRCVYGFFRAKEAKDE